MSERLSIESYRQSGADEASLGFHPLLSTGAERDFTKAVFSGASNDARGFSTATTTAVILAVASPALLCGLESLVLGTRGMRLVGSTQSLDGLRSYLDRRIESVALVDPFLAGHENTRAVIEAARSAAPTIRCVLISDEHQPHLVREAVKAGTNGFIGASADAQEIQSALLEASHGRRYISPAVAARLAESLTLEDLTSREMEVLALLARGSCNKTIARLLGVTVGTVKTHVRAIMCKLDSRSRTEAVLKACRVGLVGLHS